MTNPKTIKRKTLELFFTLGTISGTAALLYTVVHNPIAFVMATALLVHELGHYVVSKFHKADSDLPFFIPLFPFLLGITRIKNLKPEHVPIVSLAGPLASLSFLFIFILLNNIFSLVSTIPLLIFFFFELIFNYFGSDGKKYRHYRKIVHT